MEAKMKTVAMIAVAGMALGGLAATAASQASQGPEAREQDRAARLLEGRTAEPVVHCVDQRRLGGNRSLANGDILFGDASSSIVYVNHPSGGCPELGSDRYLVTRSPTGQLCAGDIVTVRETGPGGIETGSCALGDFTPYRRARR
jgi:hypothetical protein